jgi:ariadne-1
MLLERIAAAKGGQQDAGTVFNAVSEAMGIISQFPGCAGMADAADKTLLYYILAADVLPARFEFVEQLSRVSGYSFDSTLQDAGGESGMAIMFGRVSTGDDDAGSNLARALSGPDPDRQIIQLLAAKYPDWQLGADVAEGGRRVVEDTRTQYLSFTSRLWEFAEQGEIDAARQHLHGVRGPGSPFAGYVPINGFDHDNGLAALHMAALHNQHEFIKMLCSEGADPDASDLKGRTALHLLCKAGEHTPVIRARYRNDSEEAREQCAEALLESGASIDKRDIDNKRPLHYACEEGLRTMMLGFVANGAKVDVESDDSTDPVSGIGDPGVAAEVTDAIQARQAAAASEPEAEAGGPPSPFMDGDEAVDDLSDMLGGGMLGAQYGWRRPRRLRVVPFSDRTKPEEEKVDVAAHSSEDEDEEEARMVIAHDGSESEDDIDFDSGVFSKEWADLSEAEITAAKTLGYTAEEWPDHKNDEDETWPEWDTLSAAEQEAAREFDCADEDWPPAAFMFGEDRTTWEDLDSQQREAAALLGWGQDTWDDFKKNYTGKDWSNLTTQQQEAAELLEFDSETWDDMLNDEGVFVQVSPDEPEPETADVDQELLSMLAVEGPNQKHLNALVQTQSGKQTAKHGFRPIHKDSLYFVRNIELKKCQTEFGLPKMCAAAIMKQFEWDLKKVRTVYRECNSDVFEMATKLKIPYDISETIIRSDGSETIECPVMFDDTTEWTALACGHRASDYAWGFYIECAVKDSQTCTGLFCMEKGCNVPVPEELILGPRSFIDEGLQQKYRKFVGDAWIQEQATDRLKFCPAPDCGCVIDARDISDRDMTRISLNVRCICGFKFCFDCNKEAHAPASCEEFKQWSDRFETDEETQHYLKSFCKPCPDKKAVQVWVEKLSSQGIKVTKITSSSYPKTEGCGSMIYKDGGCNHMYLCPCKFHWCWQCGGPYFATVKDKNGKEHEYHTAGWFNCNNVDQAALEASREGESQKAQRWQRISDLYSTALNAERPETKAKICAKVDAIIVGMKDGPQAKKFTAGNQDEVTRAMESLFECRRTVKFFYVRQYSLEMLIETGEKGAATPEQKAKVPKAKMDLVKHKLWMDPFVHAVDQISQALEVPDALDNLAKKKNKDRLRTLATTMKTQCFTALYGA